MAMNPKYSIFDMVVPVSPVMIVNTNNCFNLPWGQCQDIKYEPCVRYPFYENIAQYVAFPRIYEKCNGYTMWGQVEERKKRRNLDIIECPLIDSCMGAVDIAYLKPHFQKKHLNNIKLGSGIFTLGNGLVKVVLWLTEGLKFLVFLNTNSWSVAVFSLDQLNKYRKYNLQVKSCSNDNLSVCLYNQDIIEYDERLHCFHCYRGVCRVKYHINPEQYYNLSTIIHFRQLCVSLPEHLNGYFRSCYQTTFTFDLQRSLEDDSTYNSNHDVLRQSLECLVCNELMVPPIFICRNGHSLCNTCELQVNNCPYCRVEIGEGRNYALESITEGYVLPCRNSCAFIGDIKAVREHEASCSHDNSDEDN